MVSELLDYDICFEMGHKRRNRLLNAEKLKLGREAKKLRRQLNKENCANGENNDCNLRNSESKCNKTDASTRGSGHSSTARRLFVDINTNITNQENVKNGVSIHNSESLIAHSSDNSKVNDLESFDNGDVIVESVNELSGNSGPSNAVEECVGENLGYTHSLTPGPVARNIDTLTKVNESIASKRLKLLPIDVEETKAQPSDIRVISISGLNEALSEFTYEICRTKLEVKVSGDAIGNNCFVGGGSI